MPIRKYKPTSPARRGMSVVVSKELSRSAPEKSLLAKQKRKSGRNNQGRITVRHMGGGHKRRYRIVDFKRNKTGIPAKVLGIEYDPNRSAHIALLSYVDGEKRYILAPKGLSAGHTVVSSPDAEIKTGNSLPIRQIPVGSLLHNVELKPQKGGQLARSAGSFVTLMSKDGLYALLKLRSGETRRVLSECMATIGEVGNGEHALVKIGKAGRNRWKGIRPTVRGVVMNPVDHPHGGGEGRTSGGRHPVSPWGKPTKGAVTRKNKRTDKYIVKSRKKK